MNAMKIFGAAAFICIGIFIGAFLAQYNDCFQTISERKDLCESLGGKYGYYWEEYNEEYEEYCERVYRFIDLDQ